MVINQLMIFDINFWDLISGGGGKDALGKWYKSYIQSGPDIIMTLPVSDP